MTKETVINDLIQKHEFKSYLEIGSQNFYSFDKIECEHKVAIDPAATKRRKELIPVTSDQYFKENSEKFDIIFIDGLHESLQVERDIVNGMKCLNKGGFIVLHDCLPEKKEHQMVPRVSRLWNGDVWRAFVGFRNKYPKIKSYCYPFDYGVGIIEYSDKEIKPGFSTSMDFEDFKANEVDLLGIVPNKMALYTVITNNYDTLKTPPVRNKGLDYICFTDNENLTSDFWEIRYLDKSENPILQQRAVKILAHKYLPEYERTIYIDGSYQIIQDLGAITPHGDFFLNKHHKRNCIFEESEQILALGKEKPENIKRQVEAYNGFAKKSGLYETGFMIRRNCKKVNDICEDWYKELVKYSIRDQMSLPVVMKRHNFTPSLTSRAVMNRYLRNHFHNNATVNIHYINCGRGDKNIGKAYNETIKHFPDNDWICISDQDCLWFPEFTCKQVEDVIKMHGDKFQIFGACTNRIASEHQRPFPEKFDNLDIMEFRKDAENLFNAEYGNVIETHAVAGVFILFRKSVWNKIKFREKDIAFDTWFSKDATRSGFKIALMKGVYVYHWYRSQSNDPKHYKKHLMV